MKYLAINVNTSGDNLLVAAVTGKRIRVVSYALSFATTVNAKFRSNTGGPATDLTGLLYGVATTFVQVAPPPFDLDNIQGHFQTNVGEGLYLNLSTNAAVGGHLIYELAN